MSVQYSDLVNKNGTIYNTKTGQGYSSPSQLAADLGISQSAIQWGNIAARPDYQPGLSFGVSPTPAPSPSPQLSQPYNPSPTPSPQPAPARATPNQQPQSDPLMAVYQKRSDLQSLYNIDGSAKNPNDPRIAGIPTLIDWAQKYGKGEEPTLVNFSPTSFTGGQSNQSPQSGSILGEPNFTTGVPQLDEIYNGLSGYIEKLIESGQKINPNIELTPDEVQKFLDQATNEVSPYYKSQIESVKNELSSNLKYLKEQYDLKKQADEASFQKTLGATRENLAGSGLAFSGGRAQQEQGLQNTENLNLESAAATASKAAGDAAHAAEGKIGSRNFSDLNLPSFNTASVSLEGKGSYSLGKTLDFYTPSNTTGSLEYAQAGDTRSLADFLKQQEIQKRTLSFGG